MTKIEKIFRNLGYVYYLVGIYYISMVVPIMVLPNGGNWWVMLLMGVASIIAGDIVMEIREVKKL